MSIVNTRKVLGPGQSGHAYRTMVLGILDSSIANAQDNVNLSKAAACEAELLETEEANTETDIGCSNLLEHLEGLYLQMEERQKKLAELQMCRLWVQQAT